MKRIVWCLILLSFGCMVAGQVPQAFNYQALLRNTDGSVKANESVALQVGIIDNTGVSVYSEMHNTQTNEFGLVNVVLGHGNTSDDLSTVDWADGPYFLHITVNGVSMGSSPLLSVPYALYAASGNEGPQGEIGPQGIPGIQGEPGPKGEPGDIKWEDIEDLLSKIRVLESMNGLGKMSDIHGNEYRTVRIGSQNWMAQNLKVTQYADGSEIPLNENLSWYNLTSTEKAYCWNNNDFTTGEIYGALYTWAAAMNGQESSDSNPSLVQGVCPDGWHLPSDTEWKQLEMHLGMDQEEADDVGSRGTDEGNKLKEADTLHWDNPNKGTNESGFTALPGGEREIQNRGVGSTAYFWTATEKSDSYAWRRILQNTSSKISRFDNSKKWGYSVRCVEGAGLPVVTTSAIGNITTSYAEGGGEILLDGGAPVSRYGICWSLTPDPTLTSGKKTVDGMGTGTFTSTLKWLTPGTTYYVRSYATNSAGTGYGNEVSFTTSAEPVAPIVEASITSIEETLVRLGGEVLSDGGTAVNARGVCWSTDPGPVLTDSKTTDGSGTGKFTSTPTGLTPATTYYIRGYATNAAGTGYGEEHSFTTLSPETITDYDGNDYNQVRICNQFWLKENLKSTQYADGSSIPLVEETGTWDALTRNDRAYCWYDNNISEGDTYGALYTWAAAMNGAPGSETNPSGVQGVCPDGWHLPSDTEWQELEVCLGMSETEAGNSWRERGELIGSKLKETGFVHWESPNSEATNESGFTALPAGYRESSSDYFPLGFRWEGERGIFWTTTEKSDTTSITRFLMHDESYIQRSSNYDTNHGYSVRCVKD